MPALIDKYIDRNRFDIEIKFTEYAGHASVLATEAKEAGIPVIIVDRQINVSDESLFTCWVGSDFREEGRRAVAWMEKTFGDQPLKLVHLQGNLGSSAQIGRTLGLDEGIANNPGWELVFREDGDFTQAKGQELVETLLDRGFEPDVEIEEKPDDQETENHSKSIPCDLFRE